MRQLLALTAAVAVSALAAGCLGPIGGTEATEATPPPPPSAVALAIQAVGIYPASPAFDPAELSVAAGSIVDLTFSNLDGNPLVPHDLVIDGVLAFDALESQQSASQSFTAPAPGSYVFYCSIGNHRELGMEGTLTVTAPVTT